jgi:stress response protein SCP2
MRTDNARDLEVCTCEPLDLDPVNDLVMGVHWDPPAADERLGVPPADLDAICALLDGSGKVLELVHPGRPRSENASVLHTGDSRTGASTWDDERIFVFLHALPSAVNAVLFAVVSVDGRALNTVPGAFCHISDAATERELIRLDLRRIATDSVHGIAWAQRTERGWKLAQAENPLEPIRAHLLTIGSHHTALP